MKILILAPLTRKINSKVTAARPRVIFDLITCLKKRGHKVSVLGTKDSFIKDVEVIPVVEKGFYELQGTFENPFYAHTSFLVKQAKMAQKVSSYFDILHNHSYSEYINLLADQNFESPMITTIHSQMTPEMDEALSFFPNSYIVTISKIAEKLAKKAKIYKTIHNGVDTNLYKFSETKEDYLLWIGRLSKAKNKKGDFMDPKGVRWAIKLAQETDSRLILSGNVEDVKFFERDVKPHLSNKIKWEGPISSEQPLGKKQVAKLMQKAKAFLMTVNWKEPFGLVMAEALSTGTPVIGWNRGSVGEIIKNGQTGFVVNPQKGLKGLKSAFQKIEKIDPHACRKRAEEHFSIKQMTDNYEEAYHDVIAKYKS